MQRFRLVASALSAVIALNVSHNPRAAIADCPNQTPDASSSYYCDGGVQDNCAGVTAEALCAGSKKDRTVVTQDCATLSGHRCTQQSQLCWTLYACVWDSETGKCKNGASGGIGSVMAKVASGCDPA
ncbi:MAG: hypothetical protein AMXMBFR22_23900 [Phycisphaerae bacterium]